MFSKNSHIKEVEKNFVIIYNLDDVEKIEGCEMGMKELVAFDVADFFLSKGSLTQKKLQKLVYYAYAWFIALNNESKDEITNELFKEQPEAWIHGPVFPSLYDRYKNYNWNEIEKKESNLKLNKDLEAFLDDIWMKFGEFTADELEYMTHQESPWIKARKNVDFFERSNKKISKEDIFMYYNGLING